MFKQLLKVFLIANGAAAQAFVALGKTRIVKTHAGGQRPEDVGVGAYTAHGRNGRAIQQHIGVAVAGVDVPMFQLRGGGQDEVGEVGRVGLEMLQHHGEQVFAGKALHHLARLGGHRDRVAVVNNQGFDLRTECGRSRAQQIVANGGHVDGAWTPLTQQVGPLQGRPPHRKMPRAAEQHPACPVPPSPGERGQTGNRPHRVAAPAHALHAVVQPNGGGLGGAPVAGQLADLFHRHATHLGRTLGRPLQSAGLQRVPAQGVAVDVVLIEPTMNDQLVHERQRQRGVGARAQGNVFMALFGGLAAPGVNADQLGPVAFGFLRDAPKMQVAANRVAAPNDDELGFGKKLVLHAHLVAQGLGQGFGPGRGANRAVQQRCAQLVKKPRRDRLALHQAHGARIAVGQDGLRVACGDGLQPGGNGVQGFVPADRFKLARTLGANPAQGLQQAIGVVGAFGVTRDLGAQHAVGRRVRRVALHLGGTAVLHRGQQCAGVGAIVRACAAHGLGGQKGIGHGAMER